VGIVSNVITHKQFLNMSHYLSFFHLYIYIYTSNKSLLGKRKYVMHTVIVHKILLKNTNINPYIRRESESMKSKK
jgi:hypothetical protein